MRLIYECGLYTSFYCTHAFPHSLLVLSVLFVNSITCNNYQEHYCVASIQVQLQLLTSIVKLFLKRPTDTQELVQQVLSLATQDSDNPDLRDRGYIYWRLLSTDPVAAKV